MAWFLYRIPYLAKWNVRFKILIIHVIDYIVYSPAEEERRKREEAERKAKLDAIAEKQRQREIELEEKAKASREKLLKGSEAVRAPDSSPVALPPRESAAAPAAAAAAAAAAPAPSKYVPKFKRGGDSSSSSSGSQRPTDVRPRDEDRWGSREERSRPDVRPLRQDGPARQDAPPTRQDGPPPSTDRWRPGSRYSSNSSSSSSTWGRPRN